MRCTRIATVHPARASKFVGAIPSSAAAVAVILRVGRPVATNSTASVWCHSQPGVGASTIHYRLVGPVIGNSGAMEKAAGSYLYQPWRMIASTERWHPFNSGRLGAL